MLKLPFSTADRPAAADELRAGHDYRPHLDGVRTVAVALVIIFHLGYTWLPGGFIGVDVFFVLSGYLITGVLLREVAKRDKVRMSWFYSRRVRRLLAASALTIAVVVVLTQLLMNAIERQEVGGDALSSALYYANWHFAGSGVEYFEPGDVPSPLIHFWSLAVEEQFYVVWPALFFGLWKLSTRRKGKEATGGLLAGILVLLGASAVASVVTAGTPIAYYGTHTRAYQLLAGGALAVLAVRLRARAKEPGGSAQHRRALRVTGTAGAVVASGALVWLAVGISDPANYPGVAGLGVTAASTALLAALELTPSGAAQRVFGSAIPAALGRMSYSLYLWHWPVVVFAPLMSAEWGLTALGDHKLVQLALIVALSAISYQLVERPVRFKLWKPAPARRVVAVGLAVSAIVGFAGASWLSPDGRLGETALAAQRDIAEVGDCPYSPETWNTADQEPCVRRKGGPFVVALVGDSHAMQWQPALEVVAERRNLTVIRVTRGGCPANAIDSVQLDAQGRPEGRSQRFACTKWREELHRRLVEKYDPDLIYVQTRSHIWSIREGSDVLHLGRPDHRRKWKAGWDSTLRALTAGSGRVVLAKIAPTIPFDVPACLAETDREAECDAPLSPTGSEAPYNRIIASLPARYPGVSVVDPTPVFCPSRECPAMLGGEIVHRDSNHISARFSKSVADDWEAMLTRAGVVFP